MSKADLSFTLYQQLLEELKIGNLNEIYEKAEEYCRRCNPLSPMTCIEHCYVWKIKNKIWRFKNERSELSETPSRNHIIHLFNTIKNKRRLKIIEILSRQPCNLEELQLRLKKEGYYHSRSTIENPYIKPLLNAGLVREEDGRYKSTLYGKKIWEIWSKRGFKDMFPIHSKGYEESCLRALANGPKTYDELTELLSEADLHRTVRRLEERGLVAINHPSARVFFFKTSREPTENLSPTEKRVLSIVSEGSISAQEISGKACITLRRTYKYLKRLKEKRLVSRQRKAITYRLTPKGKDLAERLERISNVPLIMTRFLPLKMLKMFRTH